MELRSNERSRYKKTSEAYEKPRDKPKYFCDPDEKSQKLDTSVRQRDKLAQELVAVRSDLAGIRRSLGLCLFNLVNKELLYILSRFFYIVRFYILYS